MKDGHGSWVATLLCMPPAICPSPMPMKAHTGRSRWRTDSRRERSEVKGRQGKGREGQSRQGKADQKSGIRIQAAIQMSPRSG